MSSAVGVARPSTRHIWTALALLWLSGLGLRLTLLAVPPVIPLIHTDLGLNEVEVGTWTSPGDFGDQRGKLTPHWWKLEGSQYGLLKHWKTTDEGSFVDGVRVSDVRLVDLALPDHHSIKVRIGVEEHGEHPGGINVFGRGFGNYDQDIVMRLYF